MLQKLTLFVTTKKISFYTNWRIQDAGVQPEMGSKGGGGRRWQTPAIKKVVP